MFEDFTEDELLEVYDEHAQDASGLDCFYSAIDGERFDDEVLVGEGGAKTVYKAIDQVTGRIVARAYPKSEFSKNNDEFLREARLHANLQHPNIIPVYDIGLDKNKPFFTMKFVQGTTTEEFVNSKSSEQRAEFAYQNKMLDIFLKVCDAIDFAHSRNILHLDLKPANVHISDYGEVLVGDWGLARVDGVEVSSNREQTYTDFGQYTRYGFLCGTPGFMAPEQCVKGLPKNAATDVYSLGALLLFFLTGQEPVVGSPSEKMAATKSGQLQFDYSMLATGISSIIQKALSLKPEQRYQTTKALIDDINAFRSGYLTSAEPTSAAKQFWAFCRRNRVVTSVMTAAFLVITVLTATFVVKLKIEQTRAVKQEKISRDALEKFHQAEAERLATVRKAHDNFLNESLLLYTGRNKGVVEYNPAIDSRAYQLVSRALEFNDDFKEAWQLKGQLAMLLNKLPEAIDAFQHAGEESAHYVTICKEFLERDISNPDTLVELIEKLDFTKDNRLINDLIFKKMFEKRSLAEKVDWAEKALILKNPQVTALKFNYNYDDASLDLSGNRHLNVLYSIKNLPIQKLNLSGVKATNDFHHLERLPLTELDVSNSSFRTRHMQFIANKKLVSLSLENCNVNSLKELESMPLEWLDISGIPCKDFNILSTLTNLEHLTCSSRQEQNIRQVLTSRNIKITVVTKK